MNAIFELALHAYVRLPKWLISKELESAFRDRSLLIQSSNLLVLFRVFDLNRLLLTLQPREQMVMLAFNELGLIVVLWLQGKFKLLEGIYIGDFQQLALQVIHIVLQVLTHHLLSNDLVSNVRLARLQ